MKRFLVSSSTHTHLVSEAVLCECWAAQRDVCPHEQKHGGLTAAGEAYGARKVNLILSAKLLSRTPEFVLELLLVYMLRMCPRSQTCGRKTAYMSKCVCS